MAYSKGKLKSDDVKASPYFKPFFIPDMSDKCLPTQTLLWVSFRHKLTRVNIKHLILKRLQISIMYRVRNTKFIYMLLKCIIILILLLMILVRNQITDMLGGETGKIKCKFVVE